MTEGTTQFSQWDSDVSENPIMGIGRPTVKSGVFRSTMK